MAKPGKAFIFFNCDADKSEASMNIFYNHAVYKDTKSSYPYKSCGYKKYSWMLRFCRRRS